MTPEAQAVTRPSHLPDYQSPPLNEFVLGIQFAHPQGYQQIHAGEVWQLFRDRYPSVEEYPPLPPAFETFGIPQNSGLNFGMVAGAMHDRFWFISPTGTELIQFQQDKFFHNWRNLRIGLDKYPRFESLIDTFKEESEQLETFFRRFKNDALVVNQCEISYINHIKTIEGGSSDPEEWLRFVNFDGLQIDDFRAAFRRTIMSESGHPLGRAACEAATAFDGHGKPFIVLNLTARGAPETQDIKGALAFLTRSRELLVNLFAEVTTESAQRRWGRV